MGIVLNLYRACIGMFSSYKFSNQKVNIYSICFIFWLITLMVYHFFETIFTVFNNIIHRRSFFNVTFFIFQSSFYFYLWHISSLIYLSGDVETNPGPVTNYSQGFKICHWNLQPFTEIIETNAKNGVVPINHKQCKTFFNDHTVRLKIISLYLQRLKT